MIVRGARVQKDAAQVKRNQKLNRIFGKGNQKLNINSCAERSPKVEVNRKMKRNSCEEGFP